jgi:hypothetical protein
MGSWLLDHGSNQQILLIHPFFERNRALRGNHHPCIGDLVPLLERGLRSAQDNERLDARHGQYCTLLDNLDNPGLMVRIGRGIGGAPREPGVRFEQEKAWPAARAVGVLKVLEPERLRPFWAQRQGRKSGRGARFGATIVLPPGLIEMACAVV